MKSTFSVNDEKIQIEGASLEDAIQAAARALGVERRAVHFEIDREHLSSGATTVRISARRKTAEQLAAAEAPPRPSAPRDGDRSFGRDRRDGDRGGAPSGDRGGRGGDRDGRGPGLGARREGEGGGRRDDRRGPRPEGEYQRPEKDPARDEALREKARQIAREVLEGGAEASIPDLNSYERHLVHTAVAEIGGLATRSDGEERKKTVVISKKEE